MDQYLYTTLFEEKISESKKNFTFVRAIDTQLDGLASRILTKKTEELQHIKDGGSENKRWASGLGGELAIERLLNINIIDWDADTSSKFYSPDLHDAGYNVGVKTVEYGKFHIICKNNLCPQILVFKLNSIDYLVCGIASINTLNKYHDDDLILSKNLRRKGTKTAFYGYSHLKELRTIEDLVEYKNE